MKRTGMKLTIFIVLATVTAASAFAQDLNFSGWSVWGGVNAAVNGNTVTFNGKTNLSGYVNARLNTALRSRQITLEIRNAGASEFSEGRMLKITVNKGDQLVRPGNVEGLVHGEYIPSGYSRIEFTLPNDFDGKLGFVFYRADLRGLVITATYE